MKTRFKHYLDWTLEKIDNADTIILPISILLLVLAIFSAGMTFCKAICLIGAIGGIAFCGRYLYISFWHPIARDRILVKGHFVMKVITFVVLLPFIITALFSLINGFSQVIHCSSMKLRSTDLIVNEKDTMNSADSTTTDTLATIRELKNSNDTTMACIHSIVDGCDNNYTDRKSSLFWSVYYHFVNPGSQHMTTAKGRPWAGLIAIFGIILLNGLLISTLTSWFERRKEQWTNGDIRYKKRNFRAFHNSDEYADNKIAVVIGAGENAPAIIKNLLDGNGETKNGRPYYVVLLTNGDAKEVRDRIASYLNENDSERLVIYNGQLDSIEEIKSIPIENATEIYVLGENSNEDVSSSYHDTQNMKCVHNIAGYLSQNKVPGQIVCRVQFEYQTTYSVFQFSDLPDNIKNHLDFIPFNCYENWAQTIFVDCEYSEKGKVDSEDRVISYTPLDGTGISADSDKNVHLIVVGMTKMGIAVATQAAQIAHFPNFKIYGDYHHRTKITFIDPDAENQMNFFMGRYQNLFNLAMHRYLDLSKRDYSLDAKWVDHLLDESSDYKYLGPNFLDIEWEFIKGSVEQPGVMEYLRRSADNAYSPNNEESCMTKDDNGKSLLTIAICNKYSNEAIAEGIYMPSIVYDKAQQILVYQRESSEILYNLYFKEDKEHEQSCNKRYSKLRPFGMLNADFTIDKNTYYRAMLCNYVYCCDSFGKISKEQNLNDIIDHIKQEIRNCILAKNTTNLNNQAEESWDKLSIFNKWSNKYLSNSFKTKLRSIGYTSDKYLCGKNLIEQKMESCKKSMAECEHNRWNTQQLLMGLRAYTENENNEYITILNNEGAGKAKDFKKSKQNGKEKAHLDIRSYSRLEEDDPQNHLYDEVFNACIPEILAVVESFSNDLV